ncbi:MAG TPA: FRG domain-containing protein [Bacteroidales bacterium]|nr:FRG domain-containing protein [Bacteroidales bacterium]
MKITHISDFTKKLTKLSTDKNHQLYFRGHSNKAYKLIPTLYREHNPYYEFEHKLFKETIMSCPNDFVMCNNTLEVLVKMQHYGIPTRILDLTRNALVALYFCCISEKDSKQDGEVIVLRVPDNQICDYSSDKVTILSNLAKLSSEKIFYKIPSSFKDDDENQIKKFNEKYFGYLLHEIRQDKPHFFNIINPNHINKVYAVNVKLDNPRIVRQNGAFLIFGIDGDKSKCPSIDKDWVIKPNEEKIIIPSTSKKQLLKELEILGISKANLFPELDDYGDYIKEKYKK